MLSLRDNQDLFSKYKQQTYRLALPFGVLITILYVLIATEVNTVRFYLGIAMGITLTVLSILSWREIRFLTIIEWVFYYVVVTFFFLLTQLAIGDSIKTGHLVPELLSDQVNSLTMWLIVFMVAGFLTLKTKQSSRLILYSVAGLVILGLNNIWNLFSAGQLTTLYIFRWINPLASLLIATLLIQRMGVLQQKNASTDPLTGLLNRRATYQVLSREMDRSRRYKKIFSIILLDVDHFKRINDTFGHMTGDEVLVGLSRLIENAIRHADSIGRWGGEEFLLLLPETQGAAAKTLAERVCRLIRESRFGKVDHVTASFGVSTYRGDWGLEELIHHADLAMYQAKNKGRDQVSME